MRKSPHHISLKKILIFHIGHLGDTLMIIPSLKALRQNFPQASFTLLSDKVIGNDFVLGSSLFKGSSFFDNFITFPKVKGSLINFINPILALKSLYLLRRMNFDAVAYLVPSMRWPQQIIRDKRLFKYIGIQNLFGFSGFDADRQNAADHSEAWTHEADAIMKRLAIDCLKIPSPGKADISIDLNESDFQSVEAFFNSHKNSHKNKILIGFGPGSKMQSKRWPNERYLAVGKKLISKYDIWPIIFGGPEDKKGGDKLLTKFGKGYNAAGRLCLREAAACLSKCTLYIGNDTGTMHLAASVSTPCVAIFSARDLKGKWYPYGNQHVVFRKDINCAGCMLEACEHRTCLMEITPKEVSAAAEYRLVSRSTNLLNNKREKKV